MGSLQLESLQGMGAIKKIKTTPSKVVNKSVVRPIQTTVKQTKTATFPKVTVTAVKNTLTTQQTATPVIPRPKAPTSEIKTFYPRPKAPIAELKKNSMTDQQIKTNVIPRPKAPNLVTENKETKCHSCSKPSQTTAANSAATAEPIAEPKSEVLTLNPDQYDEPLNQPAKKKKTGVWIAAGLTLLAAGASALS